MPTEDVADAVLSDFHLQVVGPVFEVRGLGILRMKDNLTDFVAEDSLYNALDIGLYLGFGDIHFFEISLDEMLAVKYFRLIRKRHLRRYKAFDSEASFLFCRYREDALREHYMLPLSDFSVAEALLKLVHRKRSDA